MVRRACKKDSNHDEVADAFRRLGWLWVDCYQFGQFVPGFPDGLAARDGRVLWVEVKTAKGRLTPDEVMFRARLGRDGEYVVVRSVDDVLELVNGSEEGSDG